MIARKQKLSVQELQIFRDKKYRLLKNLLYKYQISIKSVIEKERQDNFVAYSIVKKVSNSGWFSNQRLLALDCTTKEIFYLTKVPDFIMDESSPIQIQKLRQSPLVKQRISLNSFAKQVKNVTRNQHVLTIQFQNEAVLKGQQQYSTKKWVLEMTSTQLAKDWQNLISIIEKGKLQNPSSVKKLTVIPQYIEDLKKKTINVSSTPKSISDVQSIYMKSQILNLQGPGQASNQKQYYLTPNNKQDYKMAKQEGQNSKYFRKKTTGETINKVIEQKLQQQLKKASQRNAFVSEQFIESPKHQKITFQEIAKQLSSKPPGDIPQVTPQYLALSQQIEQPFELQFGKIRKNNNSQSIQDSSFKGKFINLNLFKKYNPPSDSVIQQVNSDFQNGNVLSQQLRTINNKQSYRAPYSKSQHQNLHTPNKYPGKLIKNGKISSEQESFQQNSLKKQKLISQTIKKQQQKITFPKSPSSNSKSSYWNTYKPVKELPNLDSSYNWNEVYFSILLEYYSLCCSKKFKDDENKHFDVLLKLEKHVEKFQLYCSRGVKNFIDHQILSFKQIGNHQSLKQQKKNKIKNLRQEIFYFQFDEHLRGKNYINVFNDHYEKIRKNSQIKNQMSLLKAYQEGVGQLMENEKISQKKRQKIISFQFEGINFKVTIDQSQFGIQKIRKQNPHLTQSLFKQFTKKIEQKWETLFNVSYLNPYFIQRDKYKHELLSYFHIFTPMVAVIEFHGLKFYCQAQFQPSSRYLQFDLNSASTSKTIENHLNVNYYLKNKLTKTTLSYFKQDQLIDKINLLHLCKQMQKNNFFVIDQVKHLDISEKNSLKQSYDKKSTNKQKQKADYKRFFTFEQGQNKNASTVQQDLIFQKMIKENYKSFQILACLENQFTQAGAMRLTSHETLKLFMKNLVPQNILSQFQDIRKLHNFLKTQLNKYAVNLLERGDLKFLLNPHFQGYVTKLLQNESVICLLVNEINLVRRDFLANLHFQIKDLKSHSVEKNDEDFVDIYRANNNKISPQQHTLNQVVGIKQFAWCISKTDENVVELKDLKPFKNQELSQLILQMIVNKAMNEIFYLEGQNDSQSNGGSDKKIRIRNQTLEWILKSAKQTLNENFMQTLDINYIYEGILFELNIEKYFDPVSLGKKSLQNQYRISQTPKNQVQKLIRDPYFSNPGKLINNSSELKIFSNFQQQKVNNKNKYMKLGWVEYISRLKDNGQSGAYYGYGISTVNSLLNSFPLSLKPEKLKISQELQEIYSLILEKDFNSAIEIYYLLINSNKKSSTIYYEYFKNAKKIKDNQQTSIKKITNNSDQKFIDANSSPSLLTYVLATQSVAYAFLQLLHGKWKHNSQNHKLKNQKIRRFAFYQNQTKKKQHSEGEKSQFHALILKYNDMSHFGAQIIYGTSHIVYFINQVIFAFTKLMNKQINQARQYFEQCERIILQKAEIFQEKSLILPVLYLKAHNDLSLGFYRSAILSVRILMKCIFLFRQSLENMKEENHKIQYWLQPYLTNLLESNIPGLQNDSLQNKLKSYNYLCFEILILCSENDPTSDARKNRQNIKSDIINELRSINNFDKKQLKFFKLLWTLETKLMVNDRKRLIKRTLIKLYDKLIREMSLKKQILNYDLKVLLNPLGTIKFSLSFLYSYSLFEQIFSKSEKYFNFLLYQFQNPEFHELFQYLHHKMSISCNKPSEAITLQHYDLKRQLFKDIILMVKFILMLDQRFVLETITSSQKK